MEGILVFSDKNIRAKDSLAANQIFSDWMRVNKKDTKDMVALSKDFNYYMKNSERKVNFELKKEIWEFRSELDYLESDLKLWKSRKDSTKVSIADNFMKDNILTEVDPNKLLNNENIDFNKIVLNTEEKKYIQDVIRQKWFDKEQSKYLNYSAIAMKANGVDINISRLKAIAAIWDQETNFQIDSKKTPEQIREITSSIKSKIEKIKYLLNDNGDKYFDIKIKELDVMSKSWKSISQYDLYIRAQGILSDYKKNTGSIKTAIDEMDYGVKAIAFDLAITTIKYKKNANETNSQFIINMLSTKPSSFGKYEINPDLLANRILNSWNNKWTISAKLFPNGRFDKLWLIKSMQNQPWWILDQQELEYIYQKYFFADNLQKFDGNQVHDKEIMKFMWIDHNAWLFASRNAAVQSALNKLLWCDLIIDGDLTLYDSKWKPLSSGQTYQKIREFASKNRFGENDLRKFISLSKSKELEKTDIYKKLMNGNPKLIQIAWNTYGNEVLQKYV